ncbi:hypothetical protein [Pararobbsia silviterrae]|uniref:MarR family transcriptional regulator n=1 Tax=Pararobbsia silviterrae TaxID=1792498 RepID=A0A494Y292_9BURK|nr:hypothetical protein [Pararobbsia silviterrae]RKP56379.1 hypothetical protein D7S86_08245 [Pararobbsia silviterrae]
MPGKTQTAILEHLESAGEQSTEQIAQFLGVQRNRASCVLLGMEKTAAIIRVREEGKGTSKVIFWRHATEEEILNPPKQVKPEFPANWPRVDWLVAGCMDRMVRRSA